MEAVIGCRVYFDLGDSVMSLTRQHDTEIPTGDVPICNHTGPSYHLDNGTAIRFGVVPLIMFTHHRKTIQIEGGGTDDRQGRKCTAPTTFTVTVEIIQQRHIGFKDITTLHVILLLLLLRVCGCGCVCVRWRGPSSKVWWSGTGSTTTGADYRSSRTGSVSIFVDGRTRHQHQHDRTNNNTGDEQDDPCPASTTTTKLHHDFGNGERLCLQ